MCILYLLFFLLLLTSCAIQSQDNIIKRSITTSINDLQSKKHVAPLDTIEDVEMLSHFVMWNYYSRFVKLESESFDENLNNFMEAMELEPSSSVSPRQNLLFSEMSLNQFLEDLRNLRLDQRPILNRSNMTLNCKDVNSIFFNYLQQEYSGYPLTRMQVLCQAATQCQSTESMLSLIHVPASEEHLAALEQVRFSQSLVRLCPLILFQLQDNTCTEKREQDLNVHLPRPSPGSVWGFSFLFVTIISFCSLIGVTVLPFTSKKSYHNALNLFEGLAVGSLIGSAIFHLIPQAFNLLSVSEDYLWKALTIFGGIYVFFWSELLMKVITEMRRNAKQNAEKSITDALSLDEPIPGKKVLFVPGKPTDNNLTEEANYPLRSDELITRQNTRVEESPIYRWTEAPAHESYSVKKPIATVAWMIIFGDGLHNFIDGLSIGAAFSESIMSGISVSVAVVCEEFPHELGDFAVLLASGMTLRQAIGYNFLSACSCYFGMALGIMIGDISHASSYILALAGGMFLYIALVDMMSELNTAVQAALAQNKAHTAKVLALQHLGILSGIFVLFLLAKYAEHIKFEGFAPPSFPNMR